MMYIRIMDNIPYEDGGMLAYGKNYRGEIYILNITEETAYIMPAPNLTERSNYGTPTNRKTED